MGKNPAEKAKMKANADAAEGKKKDVVESAVKAAPTKRKKLHATTAKRADRKCKMKACKRTYKAKGYCVTHYKEWRHGKFGRARYKTCKDGICLKPMAMNRHGYCEEHFNNYYVKGMEATKAAPAETKAPEKKEAAA